MRVRGSLIVALFAFASPARAQYTPPPGRTIETHSISDPEGALMGYYSALLILAPTAAPAPAKAWTVDISGTLGYVPPLSYDQRTAGRDKPESTNLTEVFGYPKLTLWLPGHVGVEAAYTPPVDIGGAKPYIYSFGLDVLAGAVAGVELVPRLTYTGGYIQGPITCNKSLATSGDSAFTFYFKNVCNDQESADHFEPNQFTLELNGSGSYAHGRFLPFIGLGVVRYRSTFDIRVMSATGGIDTDHPILKMNSTRGYGSLGATWVASPLWRFGGAMFWAPGSVLTGRMSVTLRLNDR